ncbi:MAG: glycosyltransferase [Leptolyngbyaceae cyanobacterium SM2_5_2]|nr:glycosyltransferase [Leptolyngbyaceae cyanobacterium SM2_5_2]
MAKFVSICIATYKRPDGLAALLQKINSLTFSKVEPPTLEVVVVDNDAVGSAKENCEQFRAVVNWTLIYEIEPQKGVSFARNKTLACVSKEADFIVFIDDDEVPESSWLDELLATQEKYNSDIVAGPVYPRFQDSSVPQWIEKGGFFDPPKHATGDQLNAAFTNNTLVRADLIRQMDVAFDPRFAFKGAEDTHLFMRLRKMGATIVWSNEAIVVESIPSSRTTLKWLIERGFWGWSSYSLFEKELFPSPSLQATRLIKGCGLIVIGCLTGIPGLFSGKHRFYKSVLKVCQGVGTLSGLFGIQGNW